MAALRQRVRQILPIAALVSLFSVGIAMLAVGELELTKLKENATSGRQPSHRIHVMLLVVQHMGSALIVAAVMGVSYEYIVHRKVVREFERMLRQHEEATEQTLDALRATTAHDVFSLIGRIASPSQSNPTLYEPAREGLNEIVFGTDTEFFTRIIGSKRARMEAVEVLGTWLDSGNLSLRFLASDFIGLLRLSELEPRLRELVRRWDRKWNSLTNAEKGCVLNYAWAASRCEKNIYESLITRLLETDDPFIWKWILFVPRQMPGRRLQEMLDVFLRKRGAKLSREILEDVILAADALHASNIDMKRILSRYKVIFQAAGLWTQASSVFAKIPVDDHHKSALARARDIWPRRRRQRKSPGA